MASRRKSARSFLSNYQPAAPVAPEPPVAATPPPPDPVPASVPEPKPDGFKVLTDDMARFWGGLSGEDLLLLPKIADAARALKLSRERLRLLRGWLPRGPAGSPVGERLADLRELVDDMISEA